MTRLLIVDDEKIIREGIAREFERHGFDVEQASDGDVAFRRIREGGIDTMILDLKMPRVGGLELLRLLAKERIDNPITVVLTGYSELSYAQEAIHFGVSDFLLKPLVPEEVEQLSKELRAKVQARDDLSAAREQLARQVAESRPVVRERLFWDLVGREVDTEAVAERLEFLGIAFRTRFFQVTLLELEPGWTKDTRGKGTMTRMKALENRIAAFFSAEKDLTVFHLSTRTFALLQCHDSAGVQKGQRDAQLEKLAHAVAAELGLSLTAGFGTIVEGIENIGRSYYDALSTLTYRKLTGGAVAQGAESLDGEANRGLAFSLEEVTFLVQTGQEQKLAAHIENTFALIVGAGKKLDRTAIYVACYKYICAILHAPAEYEIRVDDLYRDRPHPLHDGANRRTLEDMRRWILETAHEVMDRISEVRRDRATTIVEKVKAFIGARFAEDITIAVVSQSLGMSPNYLGQVFKRETGVSVHDYLNNLRIEQAKRLLKSTNLLVFEIAFKVGYRDQQYFSAVFRKRVGLTPREYRES